MGAHRHPLAGRQVKVQSQLDHMERPTSALYLTRVTLDL